MAGRWFLGQLARHAVSEVNTTECIADYTRRQLRITSYTRRVHITDEIQANREQRQALAEAAAELDAALVALIKRGYAENIPVPELARHAQLTRGRIYQILRDK